MIGIRWYLCVLLFLILFVQSVSGVISVDNLAISPSGDLISGRSPPGQVSVSFVIDFFPEGGLTFSSSDTLGMSTDLDNAQWTYQTMLDGNADPGRTATGKNLDITGWELSYPSRRDLSLRVNLTGDVPVVTATGKKTIIRVADFNRNGVVPGSEVFRQVNVILPGSAPAPSVTVPSSPSTVSTQQPDGQSPTPTVPVMTQGEPGPAPMSVSVPLSVMTVVILLIAFIPLGLLVFHDYFGLGALPYSLDLRMRAVIAVGYVLCGTGLLFVVSTLQNLYMTQVILNTGLKPVFALLVLFLASYVSLSAYALAISSIISKAFRWTLKVHMVSAVIVLIIVPITLFTLGSSPGREMATVIAITAAVISGLLALFEDHSIRPVQGKDWFTSLRDLFRRAETRVTPLRDSQTETAISILNTRLAKGEISLEEYTRLKEAIKK
jgi:hypothetical protein